MNRRRRKQIDVRRAIALDDAEVCALRRAIETAIAERHTYLDNGRPAIDYSGASWKWPLLAEVDATTFEHMAGIALKLVDKVLMNKCLDLVTRLRASAAETSAETTAETIESESRGETRP